MKPENCSYQPLSPYNSNFNDLGSVSPSSTCSSSSIPSLSTPEPEFDEQKTRNNIIQHLVSKPKPKKQYQCTQCLKSFTRPSALQTHSYTHTAEKPFQCQSPNCGRSFSVVSNLRRHFKVHQKAAVGDKLSAEDRLRCVRNLMERSDRILATKKQILPYSAPTPYQLPSQQLEQRNHLPLPQPQPSQQHQYHLAYHPIPDLNMSNNTFFSQPNMATSGSKLPMYWLNQYNNTPPSAPSAAATSSPMSNRYPSYGGNTTLM
ncbi:hypothetical protein [Parasitella parasitica]|uniref:C2H2-type domain-containing protein n=1 Tax=Parasitella parasitica TaxID=35722 RepID=A0A0B7N4L5_9FUNG|nr:hypothetical protein [Parasitella parasitica]